MLHLFSEVWVKFDQVNKNKMYFWNLEESGYKPSDFITFGLLPEKLVGNFKFVNTVPKCVMHL